MKIRMTSLHTDSVLGFTLLEVVASLLLLSALVATVTPIWIRIQTAPVHITTTLNAQDALLLVDNMIIAQAVADNAPIKQDVFTITCYITQIAPVSETGPNFLWVRLQASTTDEPEQSLATLTRFVPDLVGVLP